MSLSLAVVKIFDLIYLLLLLSILLSWFPNINWNNEPFRALRSFSEIFLAPFRRLIPPIGMIDISPIVAFIALGVFKWAILSVLSIFNI